MCHFSYIWRMVHQKTIMDKAKSRGKTIKMDCESSVLGVTFEVAILRRFGQGVDFYTVQAERQVKQWEDLLFASDLVELFLLQMSVKNMLNKMTSADRTKLLVEFLKNHKLIE